MELLKENWVGEGGW